MSLANLSVYSAANNNNPLHDGLNNGGNDDPNQAGGGDGVIRVRLNGSDAARRGGVVALDSVMLSGAVIPPEGPPALALPLSQSGAEESAGGATTHQVSFNDTL